MIKRSIKIVGLLLCVAVCTSCATASKTAGSSSFDLSSGASALGNLIEGVFTTSNLDVADLAGEWTTDGSAVQFKSENFLKKAGGLAAAAAVESKLNPYYEKVGLNGAVMTIQTDGSFTMAVKKMTLKGQITKGSDGNFIFTFQVLGMNIGNIPTYVSKGSGQMDVMFDADKLLKIVEMVSKLSSSKTVTAVSDILKSYDGICVGFKMKKTGSVEGEKQQTGLGGVLNGIFGGGSNSNSDSNTNSNDTQNSGNKSGSLLDILRGK